MTTPAKSTLAVVRKRHDVWTAEIFGREFTGSYDACQRWVNVQLDQMRKDARLRRGMTLEDIARENRAHGV